MMPSELTSGTVTLRDGAQLAYTITRSGRPDAPRLALIHTLAMDRTIWAPLVAQLPDVDVLTYDARGHGESSKSPGPYTAAQFADDLADLLDGVGWPNAIVLGASMGGSIAIEFAHAHADRVTALGLVDTTAWYGADAPATWADRGKKAQTDGFASMIGFQVTRWFSDAFREARPEIVQQTSDIFARNDVPAYVALCDMLGTFDGRAYLTAFTMPVEVLVGEEDYATPLAMSEELASSIPGAHLSVIPKVRHLTILEIPERIAELVRTLVARAPGAVVANER
jgi:3-oxoadipate enol-lactonase